MSIWKNFFKEDISKFHYLMKKEEIEKYGKIKLQFVLISLLPIAFIFIMFGVKTETLLTGAVLPIVFYKIPYVLLLMRHRKQANDIVDAVPLWINTIYALIGEHNIHNAIVLSAENCPKAMEYELKEFIKEIEKDDTNKEAYLNFLSKYEISGFRDIMMKIYEFRNLSKEKLKYEISALNRSLGGLEKLKREKRFKSELFVVDTIVMVMIGVPCIYLFMVSMLLSSNLM